MRPRRLDELNDDLASAAIRFQERADGLTRMDPAQARADDIEIHLTRKALRRARIAFDNWVDGLKAKGNAA